MEISAIGVDFYHRANWIRTARPHGVVCKCQKGVQGRETCTPTHAQNVQVRVRSGGGEPRYGQ